MKITDQQTSVSVAKKIYLKFEVEVKIFEIPNKDIQQEQHATKTMIQKEFKLQLYVINS